jgi:hypothetical protein
VFTGETVGDESAVELPDGEPNAVFKPDRRAEFASAVFTGLLFSVLGPTLFVALLAGFAGVVVGGGLVGGPYGPVVGAMIGVAVVTGSRVLVALVVGWIVGAHLTYRVYADAVVAYNTLTGEAQWSVPRSEISELSTGGGLLATVIPEWYSTLRIETYDGESHKVAYFKNVDPIVTLLEP